MGSLQNQFETPTPSRRAVGAIKAGALCLLATATALMAGCGGSEKLDKTGKPVRDKPVVLTLADHENGTLDVQNWIQEVQRRSGGTIRIEFRRGWRANDPDYDRGTIADVRAGRIDIAKIAARSWDEVGVKTFQPLVAPMLIDSYATRAAGADQRRAGPDDQGSRQTGSRRARRAARVPAQAARRLARTPRAAGLRGCADRDPPRRASPARRSPRSAAKRSSTRPAIQPRFRNSTAPSSTST